VKALTICQPYAHLICLPSIDDRHKRVENRKWFTGYRGPLAIHAGKSREWLDLDEAGNDVAYDVAVTDLVFGAVVCVVDLIDCVHVDKVNEFGRHGTGLPKSLSWMVEHQHTNGPFCFVLANVRVLREPLVCGGSQGLWDVDDASIHRSLLAGSGMTR
jgi:hypothetical protein